jgi:hypothetical protein
MQTTAGVKYSSIIVVFEKGAQLEVKILSNPFYEKITAEIISDKQQLIELKVMDINGRIRTTKTQHIAPGINQLNIIAGEDWKAGVYLLQFIIDGTVQQYKLIHF